MVITVKAPVPFLLSLLLVLLAMPVLAQTETANTAVQVDHGTQAGPATQADIGDLVDTDAPADAGAQASDSEDVLGEASVTAAEAPSAPPSRPSAAPT